MIKMYRFLLVLTLLVLVAAGLNISNQGINSLTLASRPAVIAADMDKNHFEITSLGHQFSWSKQKTFSSITGIWGKVRLGLQIYQRNACKTWRIVKVLLFYPN